MAVAELEEEDEPRRATLARVASYASLVGASVSGVGG